MKVDLVLTEIGQLATLSGHSEVPKTGEALSDLSVIRDGAIAIRDGKIVSVGEMTDVINLIEDIDDVATLHFPNMLAVPGFVDSHTHLVFGGSRENDFVLKLQGKSYLEILQAGGGILNTLQATRAATEDELARAAFSNAESMLSQGTTCVEAKSGYGLDTKHEIKMLRAIHKLGTRVPMKIPATFMGAHAIPPEYKGRTNDYVSLVINEMIPEVSEAGLADFCDVFCEEGVFDVDQSREILRAAHQGGMKLKVHADEIVQLGGAELAAEMKAVSADHLLKASDEGLEAMRDAGTIATLLPGTAFSLDTEYADARKMIDMGLPVALATDFNPNCANESMFFTIALACYKMKMSPREAISAATINGAHALALQNELGSIEVGKRADVIILDCPNPEFLSYRFGVNLVHTVVVNGEVLHTKLGP